MNSPHDSLVTLESERLHFSAKPLRQRHDDHGCGSKTKLAQIIAQAEAGEEVFIARDQDQPAVKLVPLASGETRLTRHPDLIGSTVTHDPAALLQPLPPEEWGDLADR